MEGQNFLMAQYLQNQNQAKSSNGFGKWKNDPEKSESRLYTQVSDKDRKNDIIEGLAVKDRSFNNLRESNLEDKTENGLSKDIFGTTNKSFKKKGHRIFLQESYNQHFKKMKSEKLRRNKQNQQKISNNLYPSFQQNLKLGAHQRQRKLIKAPAPLSLKLVPSELYEFTLVDKGFKQNPFYGSSRQGDFKNEKQEVCGYQFKSTLKHKRAKSYQGSPKNITKCIKQQIDDFLKKQEYSKNLSKFRSNNSFQKKFYTPSKLKFSYDQRKNHLNLHKRHNSTGSSFSLKDHQPLQSRLLNQLFDLYKNRNDITRVITEQKENQRQIIYLERIKILKQRQKNRAKQTKKQKIINISKLQFSPTQKKRKLKKFDLERQTRKRFYISKVQERKQRRQQFRTTMSKYSHNTMNPTPLDNNSGLSQYLQEFKQIRSQLQEGLTLSKTAFDNYNFLKQ